MERKETSACSVTEEVHRCDVCHITFPSSTRLSRHHRTHHGERQFQCDYCHKTFPIKDNLKVHILIHTKEKPYSCEVCGRGFEHSGKLNRHAKTHSGEKPHACPSCPKRFIQPRQLELHMCKHSGDKPFSCPVNGCDRVFKCSKHLKAHGKTHTAERPHTCEICSRTFSYKNVLSKHRRQHFSERCYRCKVCVETFHTRKEMDAHIKKEHCTNTSSTRKSNVNVSIDVPKNTQIFEQIIKKKNNQLQHNLQVRNVNNLVEPVEDVTTQFDAQNENTRKTNTLLENVISITVKRAVRKTNANVEDENCPEPPSGILKSYSQEDANISKEIDTGTFEPILHLANSEINTKLAKVDDRNFNKPDNENTSTSIHLSNIVEESLPRIQELPGKSQRNIAHACSLPLRKRKFIFQSDSAEQPNEQHTSVIQFAPAVQT